MRQLAPSPAAGFTLIELMVSLAILSMLALAAAPDMASYSANAKLRESATTVLSAAVLARSEAINRNCSVSLTLDATGQSLTLAKGASCATTTDSAAKSGLPRTMTLPSGVSAALLDTDGLAATQAVFNSAGQLAPFGTVLTVSTALSAGACSADVRCPAVLLEAGGVASLCARGAAEGACL